jgi:hypothetical protein
MQFAAVVKNGTWTQVGDYVEMDGTKTRTFPMAVKLLNGMARRVPTVPASFLTLKRGGTRSHNAPMWVGLSTPMVVDSAQRVGISCQTEGRA